MNGFEQIKSFYSWVFNNPDKIRPTHISLYLFLLNQNNRSMWVEWFKCPYDLAMQGACIGNKNTYYKCLDELQLYKLIEYKKGINNYKAPLIKLIRLYDCEPLTEQVSVPQSEPQTVPQTEPLTVLLNKNTYKLITNNYKTINNNEVALNDFIKNLNSVSEPEVINKMYDKFIDEIKKGEHQQAIEMMYSNLKLKKGSLSPLLKEFKGQLIISQKLHKTTLELRVHFYNWLNTQNTVGKLDEYKLKR